MGEPAVMEALRRMLEADVSSCRMRGEAPCECEICADARAALEQPYSDEDVQRVADAIALDHLTPDARQFGIDREIALSAIRAFLNIEGEPRGGRSAPNGRGYEATGG